MRDPDIPGEWESVNDVEVGHGDCLEILPALASLGIQFDSCVTDPPYHLTSIVKRFGGASLEDETKTSERGRARADGMARLSRGFMGKAWDGGDISFRPETWRLVYDVLKPGAYLLAFGGTRTFHRIAVAIEDAGFEIRDCVMWMYGVGFPKSHDVSKGIDKMKGAEREKIKYPNTRGPENGAMVGAGTTRPWIEEMKRVGYHEMDGPIPATPEAAEWEGWGTALKPAWEPVIVARKPLEGTVAENVLKYGTGAMNIDGCRIELNGDYKSRPNGRPSLTGLGDNYNPEKANKPDVVGRWPANAIHDGSDEVLEAFAAYGEKGGGFGKRGAKRHMAFGMGGKGEEVGFGDQGSAARFFHSTETGARGKRPGGFGDIGAEKGDPIPNGPTYGDHGSPSRFFYSAKTSTKERDGSKHPTIKPVALMRYLVRLVTQPGGLVLDPFAGTGTTGRAAIEEGMRALLIEREPEHISDILRKLGGIS